MHKSSKTWWGRRFLKVVESLAEPGNLERGRQYLSTHRIYDWEIGGNRVVARTRGRINAYYGVQEPPIFETRIEFTPIPHEAWDKALALIGSRAGYISRLLFNEMPDEIERPLAELGVSLLPARREDIAATCSCPEPEVVCKHVAALYFMLAGRLDQDPILLFELRGLSRSEMIQRLKVTTLGTALASALDEAPEQPRPAASFFTSPSVQPLPERMTPRQFWRGQRKLPAGVEPPPPAAVPGILIRKGGDYPPFWNKDESFVEVMSAFYEQVRHKGKDWL
ncbi:MAG: hypothetical protein ACKN9W_08960 [Methylococcus sp.]